MSFTITKRDRKRKLKSGAVVVQTRYVVVSLIGTAMPSPRRDAVVASVATGTYSDARSNLTIAEAIQQWRQQPALRSQAAIGCCADADHILGHRAKRRPPLMP